MNTKHLEFFKNSYYKWVNERLLDVTHIYLFMFQSLSLASNIRLLEFICFISCDLYNILVHRAIITDFILFMKSLL